VSLNANFLEKNSVHGQFVDREIRKKQLCNFGIKGKYCWEIFFPVHMGSFTYPWYLKFMQCQVLYKKNLLECIMWASVIQVISSHSSSHTCI